MERLKQTSERMDKLVYQDLLSKCIQNGLPGGGYSKSPETFQVKAEPAVGTSRSLKNSTSDSRDDPSGAAEGPLSESSSGHRAVTGMVGIGIDFRRPSFIATSHTRGGDLLLEDFNIGGFSESVLKSRGAVIKTPSKFSFRSLLEGAMSTSGINPPTSVHRMSDSGMQDAPNVEPQKNCVSVENHPLPDGRRLVWERCDGVVSSSLTPQCRREEKVLSGEGVTESWRGKGNFAILAHGSRSFSGNTVGDSGPHVLYSSLLQAQLVDDVDKVRTGTPQMTAGASLVDVEVHSSLSNLQLRSGEAKGGFLSLLEKGPLLPTGAHRASFPTAESVCIGEQISDTNHFDKPSLTSAGAESRSAEKFSERDVSESLRANVVPASPVLTRVEEDAARAEVVVDRGSFVVAGSVRNDEVIVDVQLFGDSSRTLVADELRFAEKSLTGDAMDSSEAAAVLALGVPTKTDEDDGRAILGVADSVPLDERILNVPLSEEPYITFGVDEPRSADDVPDGDALASSEAAAAIPESLVFIRVEKAYQPADLDSASCVMARPTCGDDNVSGVQLPEKLSRDLNLDESRSAEVVSDRDAIDSSEAATVAVSPEPLRTEEEVSRVERSAPSLMESDGKTSIVLVSDEASYQVMLNGSRSTGNVFIELSVGAGASASPVPKISGEDTPMSEAVVDTVQGRIPCRTFNPSDGQLLEKRIESSGRCFERLKDQFESQSDLENAGTALDPAFQASHKEMVVNRISVGIQEFIVCDSRIEYGVSSVSETHNLVSSDVARVNLSADRDLLLQKVVLGEPVNASVAEMLHFENVRATGTVVDCSSQAALKQTNHPNDVMKTVLDKEFSMSKGRIYIDTRDQMINLKEEKVEHNHMLGGPEDSSEVVKRSELVQYKALALAEETPEIQVVVLQHSESRAVNMGLAVYGTGHKSQESPSSEVHIVEPGIRNEAERVPKNHVEEIASGASDSSNSGDLVDKVQRADPDAISEGLRQAFLRDSDVTISDSLESAQKTGPEMVVGKEVQSPLATKSNDRHARHHHDSEDSHIRHQEDLESSRMRRLDDLEEDEELPYASPFNGTSHDNMVGVEVRPYKKKGRPRLYNRERAIRETGRSHFHPSGFKRKNQLHNAGNRCRRNRHIYPDQPVPVFIEGRDEGFEEADGCSFLRWVAHQDEPNAPPSLAVGNSVRKYGLELVKSIIATPSFRVVSDYEQKQQEVEERKKPRMHQQPSSSSLPTFVGLNTVQPLEYDMDDEDEKWLHTWNKRLARGGLKQLISEDKFEEVIEYFERRSTEMDVCGVGDVPGFSYGGKSLAQPVPGGYLPRTSPSGLGSLSSKQVTSGTPVSGNSSMLNPPVLQSVHPPRSSVLSPGRQAMASSSIRVGSIGKSSPYPANTVRFHTLISEKKRDISNSAVCEKTCEGLLRKPFEPFVLEKLSDDCCICNGGEDDEDNPVYTCKRCSIHVHQSCYGIREKFRDDEGRVIAPSNWCCRKCEAVAVGRAQPNVSCALCRKRGGALKPTVVARKWAHVACALYTNETFFVDPDAMEPIDGLAAVAARAQEGQERCGLCGVKRGICSLCAVKECRVPFHISCGVSQGASFELRQSKQKVLGVRSFCPHHARTTAMDSTPSVEVKDRHMLSSYSTSGATASATASGSISTASSMDGRKERSSRQIISHPDEISREPAGRAINRGTSAADLTNNVMIVNERDFEDAGRGQPKGIHFTLKRRWDESCAQASEIGLLLENQKGCCDGAGVSGGKVEAPGCKSMWHLVEPGQKLKKVKLKFGRLSQNVDLESSPSLVQQAKTCNENPQAEKMRDIMPTLGEVCGDAGANMSDSNVVKEYLEERFAKEVKELMILEEAMKSGVAAGHIMREAFVYWRTKRAVSKGSLLCELHHEQWLRSQSIFNKDASDEDHVATGKMGSPLSDPQALQPAVMSTEKTLEMAKEIRIRLERVRLMAQMVVQREELKYNHQLLVGSVASAELIRAEAVSEERHCVWCPSTKTLLKCGTCPRSFCFNCFKHRKGFGVKGWMAAMKLLMYICKYCRERSSELADFSHSLHPAPKKIGEGGAVGTPGIRSGSAIEVVRSTPVITSDAAVGVDSTSVTSSKYVDEGRGYGMGKGLGKGRSWHSPGSGLLREAEGVVMATASNSVVVTEDRKKGLRIGCGKGISWTASNNSRRGTPRRGFEDGVRNQSQPGQLEDGLNKFLSSAHSQMEYSSFETTLRKLKILRCTNTDPHQELVTSSDELPSWDISPGPGMDGLESVTPRTIIGGNVSVPSSPGSGPALLVYKKKKRLILGGSSESPPSAYYFGEQPCSPTWLDDGTSAFRIKSTRWLANGNGAAND
ncbi:hypothetical protein M758_UG037500 [Ceratodon purpureus]|nr:hypothetical protein M758_UG037500 [Ceratodon purpureus]KAG0593983.1 hypothetical protein M758_UG037500 [Ceratodon purpureus]